jgi:predicted Zn-dependent protease
MKRIAFGLLLATSFGSAHAMKLGDFLDTVSKLKQPAASSSPQNGTAQPSDTNSNSQQQLLLTALQGSHVSDAQEDEIGRQIAGNLLGAAPLVKNDALQRYVNMVGRWVSLQGERPNLAWHFGVIDTDDINAFSAPGGYIFVTKGLYRTLQNEAELAGVLGHEIGHVLKRHHLKLLQKSAQVALIGQALGSAMAKQDDGDKTSAIMQNLIGNGAEIVARSLDKDAEYEADRIGMVLTARAGYDPYALPAVLQEIGHASQLNQSQTALLFKTHPLPDDRLDHLSQAAGDRMDAYADGKSLENRFIKLP